MSEKIPADELNQWIKKVPEWELEETSISRLIEFDSYMDGIDFVNNVAEIAEDSQHHPDIDIRWGSVSLHLTTHEKGGLTAADFEMASRIDTLID